MGDFYTVLKDSIIARGLSSPAEREEAYAQARRAMINRLWSYEPPLAEDEIDHRIGLFDTAVARIEDDVAETFAARDRHSAATDAAADGDEDEVPPGDGDDDYPPAFGGTGAIDEAPTRPPPRRSIDETSRAVERALLGVDEEAPASLPASAHDEDVAGWSAAEGDAGVGAAEAARSEADAPPRPAPPASRRSATAAAGPAPGGAVAARGAGRLAALLPASESGRVRALIGTVAVLALLVTAGVVWLVSDRTAPVADPDVVFQTSVPGGVSDPDTAIRLPKEAIAVTSSFSLFDGRDPTVFASDPDNPVRFDGELARIATSAASAGARVVIGAGLSSRLAGKAIRVTIDARSARENGATSMRFAYQSGVAISHWQTANLSSEFTELGLAWRVPTMRTNPAGDYIVIEPGIPGSGTGVEIRSVRIDLVDQ